MGKTKTSAITLNFSNEGREYSVKIKDGECEFTHKGEIWLSFEVEAEETKAILDEILDRVVLDGYSDGLIISLTNAIINYPLTNKK